MEGNRVIVIAGGGTAGHLFPGVAVARDLRKRHPDWAFCFAIGGLPLERRLLEPEGFPLLTIRSGALRGRSPVAQLRSLGRVARGLGEAIAAIRRLRPGLVLGVGGYASAPAVLAGILLGRPTMLQEQNYLPGLANRLLAPFVDEVAVSFPDTVHHLGGRGIWTGNPLRRGLDRPAPPPRGAGRLRLLVFGGSQGARRINETMIAALPELRQLPGGIAIRHAAGADDRDRVAAAYRAAGIEAKVVPFVTDMAAAYAGCDLVLCRAGAGTCAELTAVGRPAILVPHPQAGGGHQRWNAAGIGAAGGGILIEESDLTPVSLVATIRALRSDPDRLPRMAAAAAALGRPDATKRVADRVERLVQWRCT